MFKIELTLSEFTKLRDRHELVKDSTRPEDLNERRIVRLLMDAFIRTTAEAQPDRTSLHARKSD